ncbi:Uncharacterized protein TCM_030231 [Theobroma cacao]|uniref:Uncharacterized protein n=1 Tax=Theobroma cacao TaxID=3641 RepID=A0A061GH44_THECC|nr:Uncharacterized protein TCM_030231 [Theobroma cacao]
MNLVSRKIIKEVWQVIEKDGRKKDFQQQKSLGQVEQCSSRPCLAQTEEVGNTDMQQKPEQCGCWDSSPGLHGHNVEFLPLNYSHLFTSCLFNLYSDNFEVLVM